MDYRPEIDGLRALAVLPVILFHAGFQTFGGGFVGVDVFFVISGYLITSIIVAQKHAGTFTLINFYERRARRILPALFVVMFACMPFAWLWLLPQEMKSFSQSLVAVSVFASNVLFWRTSGYFAPAAELIPLLHTWSLAVEEQYYLFFPIFLLLTWRFGKRWILGVLGLVAIISLVAAQWSSVADRAAAFYLLPTRGWELLVGVFVAFYCSNSVKQNLNRTASEVGGAIGVLLLVYAIFAFDRQTPFPSLYTLIPTIGTALIILFATQQTLVGKLLGTKSLVGVGLISYSAYLWHQPLFAFARLRIVDGPSKLLLSALAITAVMLAYLSWKYVEIPFRNKQRYSSKQIFAYGAVGSALFVTFGLVGHFTKGFQTDSTGQMESGWLKCSAQNMNNGLCVFGNLGTREAIVLVGDSHMGHLSKAIIKSFGDRYLIISITCGSCFFGEKLRFDNIAFDINELEDAREKIVLLKNYKVKVVIRGQRWHGYGINTAHEITKAVEDSYNFFGIDYEKMIIVGSTQEVDYRCYAIKHFKLFDPGNCKDFPKSKTINEEFMMVTRELEVPSKVHFVYSAERLCPKGVCSVLTENGFNYADQHHLTELGASLIIDDIRKILIE